MKITKAKLKQLIKEELEAFSVEEAYQSISQSPENLEANPGGAISHLDSGLSNLDADVAEAMREIDRLEGRIEKIKDVLSQMTGKMKKDASRAAAAEQPMVDAEFREDPSLAERLMEKLTQADKKRKKKLEKELDTIQHK